MNPFNQVTLAIAAACLLGGFLSGYEVADWRLTAKANAEEVERTKRAEKVRDEAIAAYNHLAGELAAAGDTHAADLRKAQNETNDLRDRLSVGSVGLRLAGKCPAAALGPQAAPGPRVDIGTGAELDSTARRAYFALRDGIDRAAAQLAACQDELRLRTSDGSKSP